MVPYNSNNRGGGKGVTWRKLPKYFPTSLKDGDEGAKCEGENIEIKEEQISKLKKNERPWRSRRPRPSAGWGWGSVGGRGWVSDGGEVGLPGQARHLLAQERIALSRLTHTVS